MKKLPFLLCFIVIASSLWGQLHPISATDRSAERSVTVDGKAYVVHYEYGAFGFASISATIPAGRLHHQALVTVYENTGKDLLFLHEGPGVYVEGKHCFEDDPDKLVKVVLERLKKQEKRPEPERGKK